MAKMRTSDVAESEESALHEESSPKTAGFMQYADPSSMPGAGPRRVSKAAQMLGIDSMEELESKRTTEENSERPHKKRKSSLKKISGKRKKSGSSSRKASVDVTDIDIITTPNCTSELHAEGCRLFMDVSIVTTNNCNDRVNVLMRFLSSICYLVLYGTETDRNEGFV
jgi:hypothetical protein